MTIREKTRGNDILEAASNIFSVKGYHKATIDDIAEAAGVGKGTVYEYFKNKNELFCKMMEYNLELYRHNLITALESTDSFTDKLNCFIDFHEQIIRENLQSVYIMLEGSSVSVADTEMRNRVCEAIMRARNAIVSVLESIIASGFDQHDCQKQNREFEADMFYAMVIRFSVRSVQLMLSEEEANDEKAKLVNMFLRGI